MKFIADVANKTWSVDEEEEHTYHATLRFGFRDNKKLPVEFNNMAYGFSFFHGEEKMYEEKRPGLLGVEFVRTDEDFVEAFEVNYLLPDEEYAVEFWIENDGEFWQSSYIFTMPRPKQPFPSWTWNEEYSAWYPPVPMPEDEETPYIWDEKNQQWVVSPVANN